MLNLIVYIFINIINTIDLNYYPYFYIIWSLQNNKEIELLWTTILEKAKQNIEQINV